MERTCKNHFMGGKFTVVINPIEGSTQEDLAEILHLAAKMVKDGMLWGKLTDRDLNNVGYFEFH